MGYLLIIFCVGIPLIKDGISVDKVCTFSTNFQRFVCPSLPYQHRKLFLRRAPENRVLPLSLKEN